MLFQGPPDSLCLHVALLQHGADQLQVGGGHVDVHVDVDGHQVGAVGAPEVHLQGVTQTNTDVKEIVFRELREVY